MGERRGLIGGRALLLAIGVAGTLQGCLFPPFQETEESVAATESVGKALPAPNYSVGLGAVEVVTDVQQLVTSARGFVSLTEGSQPGQSLVINQDAALRSSFAAIDAAFEAGNPAEIDDTIPVENFSLLGRTLPAVRNLVFLHEVNGVRAYQVVRVTFTAGVGTVTP